ncbi:MAG: OmpA family protein [Candidatus Marinimicrobia bacterium]|nr:OmpA family protein [Candidatus Neomarinimicrobiota bacterium]
MALKPPEIIEGPKAPFWLTTYGDMVTLLLTFFVLMFAMSTINERKFLQASYSLQAALGVLEKNISVIGEESMAIGTTGLNEDQIDLLRSLDAIAELFEDVVLQEVASMEVVGPGQVVVRLGDELLFDPGRANLKPEARLVLRGIVQSIVGKTDQVWVEGHTDNLPINNVEFSSNWELSTARAVSVVRVLQKEGVPAEQLAAVGHSEYIPLGPNSTAAGRALNRRVELYISWSDQGYE